ncbi:hypothetical protein BvCmsC61A_01943 [Escherichia coli]|nr:hypothetical protein BvCmsC61A_01943 [Escherichia coli]
MAIKHFPVVRFTSRGREYEVDERLITTIDKHRSEKDAHTSTSLTALTSAPLMWRG